MLIKVNFTARNTHFLNTNRFLRSGLWLRKLKNHLNSQVAQEVAKKLKCY